MANHTTTRPDLEELLTEMSREQPRVIVVVGAGVTIGATGAPEASWQGLLENGYRHLVSTNVLTRDAAESRLRRLRDAFDPFNLGKVLGHADVIELMLRGEDGQPFSDWLESVFAGLHANPRSTATLEVIRDLYLSGALIMTTNYDDLLSEALDIGAITWQDRESVLKAGNNKLDAVIHIHGHWKHPDSIVLGRASYDRITADSALQELFRMMWLDRSWVYVGCGNTLADRNFERLLAWGYQTFGRAVLPDYLFGLDGALAQTLADPDKYPGLNRVGYATHEGLAVTLSEIVPANKSWPFHRVDADLAQFRRQGGEATDPFPSWQEYREGKVPRLSADDYVRERLDRFHWAFVQDVPSVGKTTLGLRLATSPPYGDGLAFYLDLARPHAEADEIVRRFRRLAKPGTFFLLDNVQRAPEVARDLWDAWRDTKNGRLLFLSTRTDSALASKPNQHLDFLQTKEMPEAIRLSVTSADMGRIFRRLVEQAAGSPGHRVPSPPEAVLEQWHTRFTHALGGFSVAVLANRDRFQRGDWTLEPGALAGWVRKNWLDPLPDDRARENLTCLAVFGAQKLEIELEEGSLPHPDAAEDLLASGLVARSGHGAAGQFRRYGLREPEWGQLILAALPDGLDRRSVRIATAVKHPATLSLLSRRLRESDDAAELDMVWNAVERDSTALIPRLCGVSLGHAAMVADEAFRAGRDGLGRDIWAELSRNVDVLSQWMHRASSAQLGVLRRIAAAHRLDMAPVWAAFHSNSTMLLERMWHSPFRFAIMFLKDGHKCGEDLSVYWRSLEAEPERLAELALNQPLSEVGRFLVLAARPAFTLAREESARSNLGPPLGDLSKFMHLLIAGDSSFQRHLLEAPLGFVASFLNSVREAEGPVTAFWDNIERDPVALRTALGSASLGELSSFLERAYEDGRDVTVYWDSITDPDAFLSAALSQSSLDQLGAFLETASKLGLAVSPPWEALEREPETLRAAVRSSAITNLVGFLKVAPTGVVKAAMTGFDPAVWDRFGPLASLQGAHWIAQQCHAAGLQDSSRKILERILDQASGEDFNPFASGFRGLAWVLAFASHSPERRYEAFFDRVCTPEWIDRQYKLSEAKKLAAGLRLLALYQSQNVRRRFLRISLDGQLWRGVNSFVKASPEERSYSVQLIGAAALCGRTFAVSMLSPISIDDLAMLPVKANPHRAEAETVEDHQLQLWLGLRTIASVKGQSIPLSREVIEQTLRLWRASAGQSSAEPGSGAFQMDRSMVGWLEASVADGRDMLRPSDEPLWNVLPAQFGVGAAPIGGN